MFARICDHKAIALISGGLDSLLAAKIVLDQVVHVEGIHFQIGFAGCAGAKKAAAQLGIDLHIVDVIDEFRSVVYKPKHGYGAHLNPCLDCKIFMVNKALQWAQQHGFDFVVTGEVIGQRPKSQRKDTMPVVARESGAEDLLLRPLCAKLLTPTKPEREGWVDRERLYGINGRTRKPQIALAKKFGLHDYPQPAGGCLLCDRSFCKRMKDLWRSRDKVFYTRDDIALLRLGRHLRPNESFKIIVGRNQQENEKLERYVDRYVSLHPLSHSGPTLIADGEINHDNVALAARILSRFSGGREADYVDVLVKFLDGREEKMTVKPLSPSETDSDWYV